MNGVAFTFCLLCGLDQVEVEELVLRACVERTVSRKLWREDVRAEIKRQKADNADLGLEDYLCGQHYHCGVYLRLRSHFMGERNDSWEYAWPFEEQLWLASQGEFGEAPAAWKRVVLASEVRKIGRALPGLVRDGVPSDRWVEKIGRPK